MAVQRRLGTVKVHLDRLILNTFSGGSLVLIILIMTFLILYIITDRKNYMCKSISFICCKISKSIDGFHDVVLN